MTNLALEFLRKNNEKLTEYDGCCGELVDGMIHWLGEDKVFILYIEPAAEEEGIVGADFWWKYHMVALIEGLAHCAWFPELILPPIGYMMKAFPKQKLQYEVMV